jgi:hypothetical protein
MIYVPKNFIFNVCESWKYIYLNKQSQTAIKGRYSSYEPLGSIKKKREFLD